MNKNERIKIQSYSLVDTKPLIIKFKFSVFVFISISSFFSYIYHLAMGKKNQSVPKVSTKVRASKKKNNKDQKTSVVEDQLPHSMDN